MTSHPVLRPDPIPGVSLAWVDLDDPAEGGAASRWSMSAWSPEPGHVAALVVAAGSQGSFNPNDPPLRPHGDDGRRGPEGSRR